MQIILFDDYKRQDFYPLDLGRPLGKLFLGCYTMDQRWENLFNTPVQIHYLTDSYLEESIPFIEGETYYYINARVFADKNLLQALLNLEYDKTIKKEENLLFLKSKAHFQEYPILEKYCLDLPTSEWKEDCIILENPWDLFVLNEKAIAADVQNLPKSYTQHEKREGVFMDDPSRIYIHPDATVMPCYLQAQSGYIYIGPHAKINMGAMVQGSLVMLEHAELKLGAKVYGASSLGKYVKIGGEIANVIFFDYSNKGHEGFIGNSVIGSWCNFGADTNSSNLKNNYSKIKIWNAYSQENRNTEQQFLGLLMADHCKTGINTMLNTGTVAGIHSNIFGAGFPKKQIPSFYWGGAESEDKYDFEKAMITAERMMARRNQRLTEKQKRIYKHLFNQEKI